MNSKPLFELLRLLLISISLLLGSSSVAQTLSEHRDNINQALIDSYESQVEQSAVVETIDFLERGDTVQPIRIVHSRKLADKDRILVIALDDGARNLHIDGNDTVVIGVPFADRVRDLVPPVRDDAVQGSSAWENAQITTPNSPGLIQFIHDDLVPYAEQEYGPFFHKILFGYSLGGIFTLQAMMTAPQTFNAYIAGSPSLWYEYDFYKDLALKAAETPENFANRCLIMSAGEDEPSISTGARNYHRLLSGLDLPLITHYQRNAEIDHGHNRTISFIYGWDKIFNTDDIFPAVESVTANTVPEFQKYLQSWLARNSCVALTDSRMAPAWATFARKLVADQNQAEMRALRDYMENSLSNSAPTYGTILMTLLSAFGDYSETDKVYWARHYENYMAVHPTPYLAIHSLVPDVIEYLQN